MPRRMTPAGGGMDEKPGAAKGGEGEQDRNCKREEKACARQKTLKDQKTGRCLTPLHLREIRSLPTILQKKGKEGTKRQEGENWKRGKGTLQLLFETAEKT